MDVGARRLFNRRFAAWAVAALLVFALVALIWIRHGGGSGWSTQQRASAQVLVESELPQASKRQQLCVADHIAGHLSPEEWAALVERLSGAFRDAVRVEADASACAD